jgi:hypothetical protein
MGKSCRAAVIAFLASEESKIRGALVHAQTRDSNKQEMLQRMVDCLPDEVTEACYADLLKPDGAIAAVHMPAGDGVFESDGSAIDDLLRSAFALRIKSILGVWLTDVIKTNVLYAAGGRPPWAIEMVAIFTNRSVSDIEAMYEANDKVVTAKEDAEAARKWAQEQDS